MVKRKEKFCIFKADKQGNLKMIGCSTTIEEIVKKYPKARRLQYK